MERALRGYMAGLAFVSAVVVVVAALGSGLRMRPAPSTDDEATQPSPQKGPAIARRMRRAPV